MEKELLEAILNSYKRILGEISEIKQILRSPGYNKDLNSTSPPKNLMLEYRNIRNSLRINDTVQSNGSPIFENKRETIRNAEIANENTCIPINNDITYNVVQNCTKPDVNIVSTQNQLNSSQRPSISSKKMFNPEKGLFLNKLFLSQRDEDRRKAEELIKSQCTRNVRSTKKIISKPAEKYEEKIFQNDQNTNEFFNLIEKEIEEAL